jgi:hypothetical protein
MPREEIPNEAAIFLTERGWKMTTNNPCNGEPLYQHSRYSGGDYYRWYEAVAMETIGLMRIGHDC